MSVCVFVNTKKNTSDNHIQSHIHRCHEGAKASRLRADQSSPFNRWLLRSSQHLFFMSHKQPPHELCIALLNLKCEFGASSTLPGAKPRSIASESLHYSALHYTLVAIDDRGTCYFTTHGWPSCIPTPRRSPARPGHNAK